MSQVQPCLIPLPYMEDGSRYFAAISDMPWSVWLDSGGCGRFDILTAQPLRTLLMHGGHAVAGDKNGKRTVVDPYDWLRAQIGSAERALPDLPFLGGALGYWGYDAAVAEYGDTSGKTGHDRAIPDMAVGIYDWAIVLDHLHKKATLAARLRDPVTQQVLPQILSRLQTPVLPQLGGFKVSGEIATDLSWPEYQQAFDKVLGYLRSGDCYQVNLAQRFTARATGDALAAYLALRQISPAPYSAFLNLPSAQILSASPERFLRVCEGEVETKPIKGTRPRHADAAEDARIAQELLESSKDRAENLMIVDLLRNDLGKCCIPGSVRVPRLFALESYAQVHHLVSTVSGRLASGQDALALLMSCFPGGSVTGAPKRRAMEIIAELEPAAREVYCGAIGYIGFDGSMDSNIAIRTLVFAHDEIRFWAGSGIVADSAADSEYREILDKAAAMRTLLERFAA